MNRTELAAKIAAKHELSKAQAEQIVESLFGEITHAVKSGDEVKIADFGSFSAAHRAARKGRNPQTGATIDIKAKKAPKFSAGKGFKDALNHK